MDSCSHAPDRAGAGVRAYGTLLGAVRNGRLIGHDNDIDLSYVGRETTPVDVLRKAYRVERALKADGWIVRRGSGARLNVRLRQQDGSMRFVDVFTAHWVDGILYSRRTPASSTRARHWLTSIWTGGAATTRRCWATYGPLGTRLLSTRPLVARIAGWFGGRGAPQAVGRVLQPRGRS